MLQFLLSSLSCQIRRKKHRLCNPRAARHSFSIKKGTPAESCAPPPPKAAARVNALAPENRGKAFAYFIRALRTGSRNGVLFAMCQDLEWSLEGDTMVLVTDSDTIYKRLQSPDNRESVRAALESVGILSFDIRKKGEAPDRTAESLEALKKNFPDTDIEIR